MAQVASDANKGYKTPEEGRDGSPKRSIIPNRDKNAETRRNHRAMQVKPGMTVADIGTGTGYMLPHLSRAVGPKGKVFGEDIASDFLDRARARMATDKIANATLILGTDTDPKLPRTSVDIAIVLDVYHHFDYPDKMLANIAHASNPTAGS